MLMSLSQAGTTKYVIYGKFEVEGVVEKPDVIGAIFGQTEGLFGHELDLRELQKSGRVGRIEIEMESKQDRTTGVIVIPSSLDRPSTALIAAAIESVDRVGPCAAKVILDRIVDAREEKRKVIIDRARELLQKWTIEVMPSADEYVEQVSAIIKPIEISSFGPDQLPAGPDVGGSSSIIVVEGRADVAHLLRCGYRNVIAIEGAKIPETVIKLSKEKEVTAFLDGDRGGDLILKELLQVVDVDFVARAPPGKEVEELTPKEVIRILREKNPIGQLQVPLKPARVRAEKAIVAKPVMDVITELKGTLEAIILNEPMERMLKIPVSELAEKLQKVENANTIVLDGVITQRLVDIAAQKGVKSIIADRVAEITKRPSQLQLLTFADITQKEPGD